MNRIALAVGIASSFLGGCASTQDKLQPLCCVYEVAPGVGLIQCVDGSQGFLDLSGGIEESKRQKI